MLKGSSGNGGDAAILTPLAAHCFGVAFARWSIEMKTRLLLNLPTYDDVDNNDDGDDNILTICVGRDPRLHGERLADSFARGAESVVIMGHDGGNEVRVKVVYTGIASTPSMYEFVRANKCDAAVMSEFVSIIIICHP